MAIQVGRDNGPSNLAAHTAQGHETAAKTETNSLPSPSDALDHQTLAMRQSIAGPVTATDTPPTPTPPCSLLALQMGSDKSAVASPNAKGAIERAINAGRPGNPTNHVGGGSGRAIYTCASFEGGRTVALDAPTGLANAAGTISKQLQVDFAGTRDTVGPIAFEFTRQDGSTDSYAATIGNRRPTDRGLHAQLSLAMMEAAKQSDSKSGVVCVRYTAIIGATSKSVAKRPTNESGRGSGNVAQSYHQRSGQGWGRSDC
jgi:hypothetical protein